MSLLLSGQFGQVKLWLFCVMRFELQNFCRPFSAVLPYTGRKQAQRREQIPRVAKLVLSWAGAGVWGILIASIKGGRLFLRKMFLLPSFHPPLPSFLPSSLLPPLPSRRGGEKGFTWLKKLSLWTSRVAHSITTQRCFYGGCGSGTSTCCRCGHLFKKKRKLSLSWTPIL